MSEESYVSKQSSDAYRAYRRSSDGQYEQTILLKNIQPFLPADHTKRVLDAGCGDGWLTRYLRATYPHTYGCDISSHLIGSAQTQDPEGQYVVADMTTPLPYQENFFDNVLAVLSLHDVSDLASAYKHLGAVLRTGGTLIVVVANPYYSFPVGRWKRGILGRLLFRKP